MAKFKNTTTYPIRFSLKKKSGKKTVVEDHSVEPGKISRDLPTDNKYIKTLVKKGYFVPAESETKSKTETKTAK